IMAISKEKVIPRVLRLRRVRGSCRFLRIDVPMRLLLAAVFGCFLLGSPLHALPAETSYNQTILQIQQQLEQGHLDDARTLIHAALLRFPANGGIENLLGIVEAEQGNMEHARQAFSAAIRHDPKLVGAYLNLGRIEMQKAGSDTATRAQALQLYQKA